MSILFMQFQNATTNRREIRIEFVDEIALTGGGKCHMSSGIFGQAIPRADKKVGQETL